MQDWKPLLDLKPLLVFAAVIEHGNMAAAAVALGMSASAVSQHIARLEQLHGLQLLKRSTRRVEPTAAGQALAEHCRGLRTSWLAAQATLNTAKDEATGDVHIAAPTGMVAARALQNALDRVRLEHPRISVHLHLSERLQDLQAAPIDIALRGGVHALDDQTLVARPLAQWRWLICAAPRYLAHSPSIQEPADLAQQHWLCSPMHLRQALHMRRGDQYVPLTLAQWPQRLHCDRMAALLPLAEAGQGLALIISGEAECALTQGTLRVVLPDWALPVVTIYAVTPHRVQTARVAVVLETLQACFASPSQGV